MVQGCQSRFTSLAADRVSAATALLPALRSFSEGETSSLKTRARNFCSNPPGRISRRARVRPMFTPGSRACAYRTASGRAKWLSRDPAAVLKVFSNLYVFVDNQPISNVDYVGMWTIQLKGHWKPVHIRKLSQALAAVKSRSSTLVVQIDAEISNENSRQNPSQCYLMKLCTLRALFQDMVADFDGNQQLEAKQKHLDKGDAANAWRPLGDWIYAFELHINTHYQFPNTTIIGHAFDQSSHAVMQDIFHEMTHLSDPTTDDTTNDQWRNAHAVENLYSQDLLQWQPVVILKRGADPTCPYP